MARLPQAASKRVVTASASPTPDRNREVPPDRHRFDVELDEFGHRRRRQAGSKRSSLNASGCRAQRRHRPLLKSDDRTPIHDAPSTEKQWIVVVHGIRCPADVRIGAPSASAAPERPWTRQKPSLPPPAMTSGLLALARSSLPAASASGATASAITTISGTGASV